MHLRQHWPFSRNNFICTSNISQVWALLIFLLTRKRHNLIQNTALGIYECITKSNLQEARTEMFPIDFFFNFYFGGIGTIFLIYLLLILFIPSKFVFRTHGLRNKSWLLWTVFAGPSITPHVTGRNCFRPVLLFLTRTTRSYQMIESNAYVIGEITVSRNSRSEDWLLL